MNIYTAGLVQQNATFAVVGAFNGLPFPNNPPRETS
jgi:hypothetical protein